MKARLFFTLSAALLMLSACGDRSKSQPDDSMPVPETTAAVTGEAVTEEAVLTDSAEETGSAGVQTGTQTESAAADRQTESADSAAGTVSAVSSEKTEQTVSSKQTNDAQTSASASENQTVTTSAPAVPDPDDAGVIELPLIPIS